MSAKITESQIYLFLNSDKDWRTNADRQEKEDGNITLSEFHKYIENSDDFKGIDLTGADYNVINQFFYKIDTKTVGNDLNLLNSTEQEALENKVAYYGVLEEFLADKMKDKAFQSIFSDSMDENLWKFKIADALSPVINECIKEGIEPTNTKAVKAKLEAKYKMVYMDLTAQALLDKVIQDYENKNMSFLGIYDNAGNARDWYNGYTLSNDNDLKNMITKWLKSDDAKKIAEKGLGALYEQIQLLVRGYIENAGLKVSGEMLANNPVDGLLNDNKMTELQQVALRKQIQSLKVDFATLEIKDIEGNIIPGGGAYNGMYNNAIKEFLDEYPTMTTAFKNASGKNLFEKAVNHLKNNFKTVFLGSKSGKNLVSKVQMEKTYGVGLWAGQPFVTEMDKALKTLKDKGYSELGPWTGGREDYILRILDKDENDPLYAAYNAKYNEILNGIMSGDPNYKKYVNGNGTINFSEVNKALTAVINDVVKAEIDATRAAKAAENTNKTDSTNGTNATNGSDATGGTNGAGSSTTTTVKMDLANETATVNNAAGSNSGEFTVKDIMNNKNIVVGAGYWSDKKYVGMKNNIVHCATWELGGLVTALKSTGNYDNAKLSKALELTITYYTYIGDAIEDLFKNIIAENDLVDDKTVTSTHASVTTNNKGGKKENTGTGHINSYTIPGSNITMPATDFIVDTDKYNDNKFADKTRSNARGLAFNSSGISIGNHWKNDKAMIVINVACMFNMFQKIYNQL